MLSTGHAYYLRDFQNFVPLSSLGGGGGPHILLVPLDKLDSALDWLGQGVE